MGHVRVGHGVATLHHECSLRCVTGPAKCRGRLSRLHLAQRVLHDEMIRECDRLVNLIRRAALARHGAAV